MNDIKSRVIAVMRERAAMQDKALDGAYPFRIATWNLRISMERRYPEGEWKCSELRKVLAELVADGLVSKCPHESRIGQAVWKLEVKNV